MARLGLLIVAISALLACSPRGTFTSAPAGGDTGSPETVFVGTTRLGDEGVFTRDRADEASFLRYDISIPAERTAGELNWPPRSRAPDTALDFLTLSAAQYADGPAFATSLRGAMARRGQTDAVVYVHGFNTTMAEGVYRVAQMHHDLKVPGVAIHYAWPSRGSALGYVYDRDSALFSRSGFEDLLDRVAEAGTKEIVIVAHSMGAALTMETLRQMALRDRSGALDLAGP
jgi:esterase/lipase superfamily enzyme